MNLKKNLLSNLNKNKNSNSNDTQIGNLEITRAESNPKSSIDGKNTIYVNIEKIRTYSNDVEINKIENSKIKNIKNTLSNTAKSFGQYLGLSQNSAKSDSKNKIEVKDITDKSIYLCKVKGDDSKKTLTSTSPICIEAKFINDEYKDEQDYKNKYVDLSINVKNAIIRTATLPTMKDKELINALGSKKLWHGYNNSDTMMRKYSIIYQVIKRTKSCKTMDVLFIATKLSDTNIHSNNKGNYQIVDTRCNIVNNLLENQHQKKWPNVYLNLSHNDNYAMIIDSDKCHVFDIHISEIEKNIILNNSIDDNSINFLCANYAKQINSIIFDYEYKNKLQGINNIFIVSSPISSEYIINRLRNMLLGYNVSEYNFLENVTAKDEFSASFNKAFKKIISLPALFNKRQRFNTIYSQKLRKLKNSFILSTAASSILIVTLMVSTFLDLRLEEKKLSKQLSSLGTTEQTHNKIKLEHDKLDNLIKLASLSNDNQQKLLSVYHYLNLVTLEDVWLREINFVAPNSLEISGGSYSDGSILEFIDLLNDGDQFNKVSLRNMNSVREVSMQTSEAYSIKTFIIESTIAETATSYKKNDQLLADANDY